MERVISIMDIPIPVYKKKNLPIQSSETGIAIPQSNDNEPVRISKLLEPVRQIINHPDRNRLMAELFKDYK